MLFNSLEFLLFFPIVTLLYFMLPHRYRWFHLLVASCVFYMFFIPVYILILFFTIVIDYYAGIYIENTLDKLTKKRFLIISIIANVGVLCVFKYYNFFIDNVNEMIGRKDLLPYLKIALPIGLSFHTFQAMSYTIEVYRGNQKAERHFGYYALYVMFYPQLVAGPIERPQNILHQFHEEKQFNYQFFREGMLKMLWGFFKKIVIADRLSIFVNTVFGDLEGLSGAPLLFAVFFFAIQIYCDFSGYSDIAIGSAKVMGFDLMTNFNRPYFSKSIADFWRRWHISLSTWFRDYVYYPLGGSRVSRWRKHFNIMCVFLISGIWHGAGWNFLIWGFIHGAYQIIEREISPIKNKVLSVFKISSKTLSYKFIFALFTFSLVAFAWVFFRAKTFNDARYVIAHMLDINFNSLIDGSLFNYGLDKADFFCGLIAILVLIICEIWQRTTALKSKIFESGIIIRWGVYLTIALLIIFFGKYENYSDAQFIYFQF